MARTFEIGVPIAALLSPSLNRVIFSLLMQLATRLFGGIPGALASGLRLWIGAETLAWGALVYVVSLTGGAFFVWYVVLVVVGPGVLIISIAMVVGVGILVVPTPTVK